MQHPRIFRPLVCIVLKRVCARPDRSSVTMVVVLARCVTAPWRWEQGMAIFWRLLRAEGGGWTHGWKLGVRARLGNTVLTYAVD